MSNYVKPPRSEKQKEASRVNGKNTKGAVTPEGKIRSSSNALKHGGYAERFVPVGQNVDAYQEYFDRHYGHWKPTDALEEEFVHQLIRYGWQIQFNAILQSAVYSNEILNYYRSNLSLDYRKKRNISKMYLPDQAKTDLNKSDELLAIAFQQDLNGNQCLLALDDMDSRVFVKFQKTLEKLLEYRRRKDEL